MLEDIPSIEVVLYTSRTCGKCMIAKKYLESRNVKFDVRDISIEEHRQELAVARATTVPVIKFGSEFIIGFDKERIDTLINAMQEEQ